MVSPLWVGSARRSRPWLPSIPWQMDSGLQAPAVLRDHMAPHEEGFKGSQAPVSLVGRLLWPWPGAQPWASFSKGATHILWLEGGGISGWRPLGPSSTQDTVTSSGTHQDHTHPTVVACWPGMSVVAGQSQPNVLRVPSVSSSPSSCIQEVVWRDRWTDRQRALLSSILSLRASAWVLPDLQSETVAVHHSQMKPS